MSENFKQSFEEAKEDWLSSEEEAKLKDLFGKLSIDKKEEYLNKISDLNSSLDEGIKSFLKTLEQDIKTLKQDIELNDLKWGFEELKSGFEQNEATKEAISIIEQYIDFKLDDSFNPKQKDAIKLALLWEIISWFNVSTALNDLMNRVINPLKKMLESFNGSKKDGKKPEDTKEFSDIQKSMKWMFKNFGFDLKLEKLDKKIDKINSTKQDNSITDLKSVLTIINPGEASNISFDTIKTEATKIAETLWKWRNTWNDIEKALDKLPFDLGWIIKNWIQWAIEKGWFFWIILWLLFGKDFLDKAWDKRKKSVNNLKEFSKDSDFPLKDNIKYEDLKDLDPKKLEKFYKFIDSKKKVNSSSDTFWKELLTWTTDNEEIKNIYKLLKGSDWKILWENEKLEDLITKLNNLNDLESDKKIKSKLVELSSELSTIEVQIKEREKKVKKLNEKENLTEEEKEERGALEEKIEKEEDKKVEIEKKQTELNKTFEELLKKWRIKVWSEVKNISINENTHNLKIWSTSYKVTIDSWVNAFWNWISLWDKLETISFQDGYLTISVWDKEEVFNAGELKNILKELILNGSFSKNIPWELAKLVITKI